MKHRILFSLIGLMVAANPAYARHHHRHKAKKPAAPVYSWEKRSVDLSPVAVQQFATPKPIVTAGSQTPSVSPARAKFIRKMNLEDGLYARGTRFITRPDIRSRDLFILDVTQSLEGGFDTVNLYDKGIFSWGLMQWTARSGSLVNALNYIKSSLAASHDQKVWQKYFVANGVDVAPDHLILYGKPMLTAQDLRLAIRGTIKVGEGDPELMNHWVTTFARAGRQGQIATLEIKYASHVVDAMLHGRLRDIPYHLAGRNGVTPSDMSGDDPYTQALMFAIWTNNPRHARQYIADAAKAARSVSASDDPSLWAPGAFSDALFRACNSSTFGNWSRRAAMIQERATLAHVASAKELSPFEADYQTVIAERKRIRTIQVASRHTPKARPAKVAALTPKVAATSLAIGGRRFVIVTPQTPLRLQPFAVSLPMTPQALGLEPQIPAGPVIVEPVPMTDIIPILPPAFDSSSMTAGLPAAGVPTIVIPVRMQSAKP